MIVKPSKKSSNQLSKKETNDQKQCLKNRKNNKNYFPKQSNNKMSIQKKSANKKMQKREVIQKTVFRIFTLYVRMCPK